jgi:hypothetical protein
VREVVLEVPVVIVKQLDVKAHVVMVWTSILVVEAGTVQVQVVQ